MVRVVLPELTYAEWTLDRERAMAAERDKNREFIMNAVEVGDVWYEVYWGNPTHKLYLGVVGAKDEAVALFMAKATWPHYAEQWKRMFPYGRKDGPESRYIVSLCPKTGPWLGYGYVGESWKIAWPEAASLETRKEVRDVSKDKDPTVRDPSSRDGVRRVGGHDDEEIASLFQGIAVPLSHPMGKVQATTRRHVDSKASGKAQQRDEKKIHDTRDKKLHRAKKGSKAVRKRVTHG